ncbi:NAD(P)-binding Rossmann-fold containing protein [Apiospora marii]|uniref:NAD(P)-binding Rossmann-fold containing protein n=1 Tax=Apiospora marii TaxID=335849 RepID=A0ABR1RVD2_9PEZI
MPDLHTTPEDRATLEAIDQHQPSVTPPAVERGEVEFRGKTAIVIGANTGRGLGCARHLYDMGIKRLILAVRNEDSGLVARGKLLNEVRPLPASVWEPIQNPDGYDYPIQPGGNPRPPHLMHLAQHIEVWHLDLASYDSITAFADRARGLDRLDFFNTADIDNKDFVLNPSTGHEEMVQVNYLSPALLTVLMLPILCGKNPDASSPGHLLHVNYEAASWTKSELPEPDGPPASLFAALDDETKFDDTRRYHTTKLLGQLFLAELGRRVPPTVEVFGSTDGVGFAGSMFNRLTHRADNVGGSQANQTLSSDEIMAPLVHTPEGVKLAEQLWEETMQELEPFEAERTIESLGRM